MRVSKLHVSENQSVEDFSLKRKNLQEFAGKSDAEVWNLFKDGSEVAFIYIYDKYFNHLFNYGSQFTVNREFIKDAIQDLFLELNVKREKLSETDNIRFYLMKSIKQKLIRILKSESRFEHEVSESKGMNFEFTFPLEQILIDQQIDKERRDKLNAAIANLTNKQREIIFYHYYEGFNMETIVELMDFEGKRCAQNLLYRSIAILRTRMLIILTLATIISRLQ
ncbi:MAG: RNA polymerase sigma factor [Cyclobacteriaceae bacterium]